MKPLQIVGACAVILAMATACKREPAATTEVAPVAATATPETNPVDATAAIDNTPAADAATTAGAMATATAAGVNPLRAGADL